MTSTEICQNSFQFHYFLKILLGCFVAIIFYLYFESQMVDQKNFELLVDSMQTEIDQLRSENEGLKEQLATCESKVIEPSFVYEKHRRKVIRNLIDFWDFFKNKIKAIVHKFPNTSTHLMDIYNLTYEYKLMSLNDLEIISRNDGYDLWRKQASDKLSKVVQERFQRLQHPQNCSSSKALKCRMFRCGWGCEIHHVAENLNVGHYFNKMVIYDSSKLWYTEAGFDSVLQPFVESCKHHPENVTPYDESWYFMSNRLPDDIEPMIVKLTDMPLSWWFGQLVKFSVKYKPHMLSGLNDLIKSTFTGEPIVAVHVRRTDKFLFESKFIPLERFMNAVDEYFDQLQLTRKVKQRRIYLSSDDWRVFDQMKKKYPHYKVYSSKKHSNTRYSKGSLKEIVTDIEMLSRCDYAVCTFSSNICRLILEYFQLKHIDSSFRVKTLDHHYTNVITYNKISYIHGKVIMDHSASRVPKSADTDLKVGDYVVIDVEHHIDGEFSIYNNRTHKKGIVPSFKIEILNDVYRASKNFSLE